jgi:hypothetical protein
MARATRYKVVETQTVTDEELERIINEWVGQGWVLDGVQFAMRESSKRPAMAFVTFTRTEEEEGGGVNVPGPQEPELGGRHR